MTLGGQFALQPGAPASREKGSVQERGTRAYLGRKWPVVVPRGCWEENCCLVMYEKWGRDKNALQNFSLTVTCRAYVE